MMAIYQEKLILSMRAEVPKVVKVDKLLYCRPLLIHPHPRQAWATARVFNAARGSQIAHTAMNGFLWE